MENNNIFELKKPTLTGNSIPDSIQESIKKLDHGIEVLDSLLLLLNGKHNLEAIYGKLLIEGLPVETIHTALETLSKNGLLSDQDPQAKLGLTVTEKEFYTPQIRLIEKWVEEQQSIDTYGSAITGVEAQNTLKNASVLVVGDSRLAANLIELLAMAGIGTLFRINLQSNEPHTEHKKTIKGLNPYVVYEEILESDNLSTTMAAQQPGLMVYCPDRFDDEICERFNTISLNTNIPYLFIRHDPISIEIGPMVIPHETACFACYRQRRDSAQSAASWLQYQQTDFGYLPFFTGNEFVTLEIVKFLTKIAQSITRGRLWRLNLMRGLSDVHPVLKLPRCPTCGVHRYKPPSKLWEE